ncbi:hypothetical protein PLICRDRAFT_631683 [Plicaturopsis crispa FD-325 SS-3]|nr:hypothetical protein PLICRDRAFT_631683 [Plicaturopsis crispa FD-325 SS-3]
MDLDSIPSQRSPRSQRVVPRIAKHPLPPPTIDETRLGRLGVCPNVLSTLQLDPYVASAPCYRPRPPQPTPFSISQRLLRSYSTTYY